ncbi:MAG TPA: SOS response-associated peptidase [Enhygromyxa sp.]|nr:SOS response-associated peptidase [Enhygromyxa sp.]
MCGRLSLTSTDHRAAAGLIAGLIPRFDAPSLGAWLERSGYHARYNVGPGQDHWVVRARDHRPILARASWGLPGGKGQLIINARAETVSERPMFRAGFNHDRCLVVADGFFEWDRSGARPQPWWFRDAADRGLLFAAVLTEGRFAVVTVPANPDVERFHSRMPAIIDTSVHERWLYGSAADARPLLHSPPPGGLRSTAVSRRINSIEHDDPACVEPVELASPPASQLSLIEPG